MLLSAVMLAIPGCGKPAAQANKAAGTAAHLIPGDPARGRRIFSALGCATCHAITGSTPQGPPLANYWMTIRRLSDGREVLADEPYTRRALLDPQADIVPGYPAPMPGVNGLVNDEQIADLIAYIKSLSNP